MLHLFIEEIVLRDGIPNAKKRREFAITGEAATTIGRAKKRESHIKLSFPEKTIGLSRIQATIFKQGKRWYIYDGKGDGRVKVGQPIRTVTGEEITGRMELFPGSKVVLFASNSAGRAIMRIPLERKLAENDTKEFVNRVNLLRRKIDPLLASDIPEQTFPPVDKSGIANDLQAISAQSREIGKIAAMCNQIQSSNKDLRASNARQDKELRQLNRSHKIQSKAIVFLGIVVFAVGLASFQGDDKAFDRFLKAMSAVVGLAGMIYGGHEMTTDKGKNPYLLSSSEETGLLIR